MSTKTDHYTLHKDAVGLIVEPLYCFCFRLHRCAVSYKLATQQLQCPGTTQIHTHTFTPLTQIYVIWATGDKVVQTMSWTTLPVKKLRYVS